MSQFSPANSAPNPPILAIVGPTAAGKTRIAFELAQKIGGEVISVDSRQVYRFLDIGTDKISPEDRKIVPHHLIDVADPDEVFTAADFVRLAEAAEARIRARGRVPILAGGSPMYYRALDGSLLSGALPRDDAARAALEAEAASRGLAALHAELAAADPASAAKIHPNDKIRIVRALEIYRLSGRAPSELYAEQSKLGGRDIRYIGITMPREALVARIEARVREQFAAGYADEVATLLERGYSPELPALQGFGYRELVLYAQGKMTLDEALEGDIKATKTFSRRQMTWFRQFLPIMWYDIAEIPAEEIIAAARGALESWNTQ